MSYLWSTFAPVYARGAQPGLRGTIGTSDGILLFQRVNCNHRRGRFLRAGREGKTKGEVVNRERDYFRSL